MIHLFYSTCYPSPHLETELEIASDLISKGEKVYFLICNAQLATCFVNTDHSQSICNVCKSKVKRGLDLINIPAENRIHFSGINSRDIKIVQEFDSIQSLKQYQHKGADIGMAAASSIISALRDHDFDVKLHQALINTHIKTGIYVYESMSILLEKIKPDFVYLFNGRFIESRPVMRLCEQKGIPFFTHERGGNLKKYMLRKNQTPHSIKSAIQDINELWGNGDTNKVAAGERFFHDRRKGIIHSWSSFTDKQKLDLLPPGFDSTKRNMAIFNSSMDEYEGISDFSNTIYDNDNEAIAKVCEDFLHDQTIHFYLRIHPNLSGLKNTQMKQIANLNYSNLTIIQPESPVDTYTLMNSVEKVISFGSTMGIEALYWGKPSILLGRSFYETSRGLFIPKNHEETISFISSTLSTTSSNEDAIKFGYWCGRFGTDFKSYSPSSVFSGKFNGVTLKSRIDKRLRLRLSKLFSKY